MITRRHFLSASAALVPAPFLPALSWAQTNTKPVDTLRAEPVKMTLLPDGPVSEFWGLNGGTPGPLLRLNRGERLVRRFENGLPQGSSLHWHGIRIDNAMDGVPQLTQPLVQPGAHFEYDFALPDAGTYWYHSHNRSWEQVARGIYGALIVQEDQPPVVDHDLVVFIDDWLLQEDGQPMGDYDNMHDQAHGGRLGNFAKAVVQGQTAPLRQGQRVRLRLINVATDRIFPLEFAGLEGYQVALDGMPLTTLEPLDVLVLAPAQRVDIIADVTADAVGIDFATRDGGYNLITMTTEAEPVTRSATAIAPLEANRVAAPDLAQALKLSLSMEGGAMSRRMMTGGMADGIWALNGVSGMTDTPFHRFENGQTAIIDLVNDTRFPHAMHLHGHHFHTLTHDQNLGPLRDTLLVDAGESVKIACVFDNPGKWLLHCHMLSHQAAGMKTWLEVAA